MSELQRELQRAAFATEDAPRRRRPARGPFGPPVIEVRDLQKSFRLPGGRVLEVLRGVSFDVCGGEFVGVVGRNGSGKSTLLKVLSSIYRADSGSVRVAGRLAPFIELGVGFNVELTARENVALNGVLMGLSRREAAGRLDAVLEFAELGEFVDLKLKNYSSGMLVRLAFAVMAEADADVMLIDEVLAVGDAAFARKCMDVFEAKRAAGKTLVLVTHDMATVQSFCDRALVIDAGELAYVGDPEEAALAYYRLNFGGGGVRPGGVPDVNVRLVEAWLEDPAGNRVENVAQGDPIHLHTTFQVEHPLTHPAFAFDLRNVDGALVGTIGTRLLDASGEPRPVVAGERIQLSVELRDRLMAGRYSIECSVTASDRPGDFAVRALPIVDFLVKGSVPHAGMVFVDTDLAVSSEDPL